MGNGMIRRLLAAGLDVTVWNRTAAKCEPLVAAGAKAVGSAKEVVEACDITFSCVSDPAAAEDLVFMENGVLAGITAGKGYVDMSTVDGGTAKKIGEAITAKGGRYVEAPVSGSKGPAEQGTLIILAAGDQKLAEESQAAFDQMGKKTFFLGEVGQGARMKLVINTLMSTTLHAMCEGLSLGTKAGLDGETILEVLQMGAAASPVFGLKGPKVLKGDFTTNFPLKHAQKDVRLGLLLGDEVGQSMPTAAATNESMKRCVAEGNGDLDFSAMYKTVNGQ
jgi:3-hydroxyisobutyrate dehydrogenase-like beta-hydroxyacid dehydrogenase